MHKKFYKYIEKHEYQNLENKTIIITGGNSGIGLMSAKYLCYLKANVIITVRNLERGKKAIKEIKEEIPYAKISMMELDMSHEQSIKDFVKKIQAENIDIDFFYHNAGVYRLPFELVENKDIIIGTNYYGQLMLTSLLLPYLHSLNHEVKIAFTSSIAARWSNEKKISLSPNEKQSRMQRYSNSKLLDAYLFKYLLENDHKNISYFLLHPGFTKTGLFDKAYKNKIVLFFINIYAKIAANPLWKSSLSVLCTFEKDAKIGKFYGPNNLRNFVGYPKECNFLNNRYKNVDKVIEESEKIVGYQLLEKNILN